MYVLRGQHKCVCGGLRLVVTGGRPMDEKEVEVAKLQRGQRLTARRLHVGCGVIRIPQLQTIVSKINAVPSAATKRKITGNKSKK